MRGKGSGRVGTKRVDPEGKEVMVLLVGRTEWEGVRLFWTEKGYMFCLVFCFSFLFFLGYAHGIRPLCLHGIYYVLSFDHVSGIYILLLFHYCFSFQICSLLLICTMYKHYCSEAGDSLLVLWQAL